MLTLNFQTMMTWLVAHPYPLQQAVEAMDKENVNKMPFSVFEIMVKEMISHELRSTLKEKRSSVEYSLKRSYSLKNLRKYQLILVDESEGMFSFSKFFDQFIRFMSEQNKVRPITDKRFKAHAKELDDIIQETTSFNSKTENDRTVFLEYIQEFLFDVKQDFETNKNCIISRTDNLSNLLNAADNTHTNRLVMPKIIELCDKYVEPFFYFISSTKNPQGFIPNMVKLRTFFDKEERYTEESEVNKFIINFSSYIRDIKTVYDKINDYRRKGQHDLIVFNAFEKAFNDLNETIIALQDGKMTKNHLESDPEYINKFPLLNDLKVNNERASVLGVDYQSISGNIIQIEKTLSIFSEVKEEATGISEIDAEALLLRAGREKDIKERAKLQHRTTRRIQRVLSHYMKYLRAPDSENDLLFKLDKVLRPNVDGYTPFYALYAYIFLRKTLTKVTVGFNQRKYLTNHDNKQRFSYRPVFVKG
jgi:hypothetical protein